MRAACSATLIGGPYNESSGSPGAPLARWIRIEEEEYCAHVDEYVIINREKVISNNNSHINFHSIQTSILFTPPAHYARFPLPTVLATHATLNQATMPSTKASQAEFFKTDMPHCAYIGFFLGMSSACHSKCIQPKSHLPPSTSCHGGPKRSPRSRGSCPPEHHLQSAPRGCNFSLNCIPHGGAHPGDWTRQGSGLWRRALPPPSGARFRPTSVRLPSRPIPLPENSTKKS